MIHDALGCCEDDVSEQTRRQKVDDPLLNVVGGDIKAWRYDTGLVEPPDQVYDNPVRAVVIDNRKVAYVAVLLHELEKLDDDLRRGANDHLLLPNALGVANGLECVTENIDANHAYWICFPARRHAVCTQRAWYLLAGVSMGETYACRC